MKDSPAEFGARHSGAIARMYAQALEAVPVLRGQLAQEKLAEALHRSAAQRFPGAAAEGEVEKYLESVHAADLALACALSAGNEAAWDYFVREYRPALYAAGRAVAGESGGRELADSLYADLYGLEEREGRRRSLLDYFHGRSKLTTWLRAVLAQRHVDAVRAARRTVSLDGEEGAAGESENVAFQPRQEDKAGKMPALRRAGGAAAADPPDPDRARYLALLEGALTRAIAALEPRDRLRLSYYYVQELTLAEIGRLLGEHEATVSRKLERMRAGLRKRVERELREEKRLSEAQIELSYEYAMREWAFDLAKVMEVGGKEVMKS